jgi:hypothetical protein
MEIELNEYSIAISGVEYIPETPARLTGHPDTWHDGCGAELYYDVESITRYGDEQDDIQVLTEQERSDWLSDNGEALDAAVMEAL